jgi:hypothetical protein
MKLLGMCLGILLLAGCQSATTAPAQAEAPAPEVKAVEPPATTTPTIIALAVADRPKVTVGEEAAKAYEGLLAGRTGGFVSERLPQGFDHPYTAKTWQGAEDGFGIIAYEGKVVAAMQQEMRTTQEHANNVRAAYVDLMQGVEPETIGGEKVTYYFWNRDVEEDGLLKGRQILMIMVFQRPANTVFLVAAIGDERVMNALGMNQAEARADQIAADQLLRGQEAGANARKS